MGYRRWRNSRDVHYLLLLVWRRSRKRLKTIIPISRSLQRPKAVLLYHLVGRTVGRRERTEATRAAEAEHLMIEAILLELHSDTRHRKHPTPARFRPSQWAVGSGGGEIMLFYPASVLGQRPDLDSSYSAPSINLLKYIMCAC